MNIFVAGGAGFIGSHVVQHLMRTSDARVTIFDNFSSGRRPHLEPYLDDPRLTIVEGDLKDLEAVRAAMSGAQRVFHFASNPDIAKAMAQPDVDFWEGTYLTSNLLEAMRTTEARELVYASGSGVYGDVGTLEVTEDHSPLLPISPYGASKLACEAMVHAYCHMFGFTGHVFRFANVVGDHQTHGVAYDFIRRLRLEPHRLEILGDGTQSKSYIHVDDVVGGIQYFVGADSEPYTYYHLATGDYVTVKEIADLIVAEMGLSDVAYSYTGGSRGWKGDVPVVRFDLQKTRSRGWQVQRSSREALRQSVRAMIEETAPA